MAEPIKNTIRAKRVVTDPPAQPPPPPQDPPPDPDPLPGPQPDQDAIKAHVRMLHHLTNNVAVDGLVVLTRIDAITEAVHTERFALGDAESMEKAVIGWSGGLNLNLYTSFAVFRNGMPHNARGGEDDVVAVLVFVGDLDSDTGKAIALDDLPLEAPYVIETSAGNFQPIFPLATALTAADAKPLAEGFGDALGDPGAKDICHVWRIPGTLNWPNAAKLKRGRPPEPQLVKIVTPWGGDLVELDDILEAIADAVQQPPPRTNSGSGHAADHVEPVDETFEELPAWLAEKIVRAAERNEDRSTTAASVVWSLFKRGWDDDAVVAIIKAHPNGIGERYLKKNKNLAKDVARLRRKWDARPVVGNTNSHTGAEPGAAPPPLVWSDLAVWHSKPTPTRRWAIENCVPLNQVGLLTGEGGTGKSLVELMKNVAHVGGFDWYGLALAHRPTIYLGAEEEDELHIRVDCIARHYGVDLLQLKAGGLHILPLFGKDSMLCEPARKSGKIETTPLYNLLYEAAADIKPVNISIDTLSRVFGGNEILRVEVYAFAQHMQALAKVARGSVTVLAHPSLSGMASGSGLSGSTAWHGAFRFRQYLHGVKEAPGEAPDDDLRELEFKKNQYGPRSQTVVLRYRHGLFLPEHGLTDLEQAARAQGVENVFLELLAELTAQGRNVSHKRTSSNNASTMFAATPRATGLRYRKADFEAAMERLFTSGEIVVEHYGKPSDETTRIVKQREA